MSWHVYIIQCHDTTLCTGIANDLSRRIQNHNSGTGSKYTKCRRPITLIRSEEYLTKSEALKKEAYIKSLPRAKKLKFIQ